MHPASASVTPRRPGTLRSVRAVSPGPVPPPPPAAPARDEETLTVGVLVVLAELLHGVLLHLLGLLVGGLRGELLDLVPGGGALGGRPVLARLLGLLDGLLNRLGQVPRLRARRRRNRPARRRQSLRRRRPRLAPSRAPAAGLAGRPRSRAAPRHLAPRLPARRRPAEGGPGAGGQGFPGRGHRGGGGGGGRRRADPAGGRAQPPAGCGRRLRPLGVIPEGEPAGRGGARGGGDRGATPGPRTRTPPEAPRTPWIPAPLPGAGRPRRPCPPSGIT